MTPETAIKVLDDFLTHGISVYEDPETGEYPCFDVPEDEMAKATEALNVLKTYFPE